MVHTNIRVDLDMVYTNIHVDLIYTNVSVNQNHPCDVVTSFFHNDLLQYKVTLAYH